MFVNPILIFLNFFCTIDIFATKLGVWYVKHLGVHLDKTLLVKQHISGLCHITFLALTRITSIQPFLSNSSTAKLVASMIMLRLDYYSAAFTGVPDKEIPTRSIVHTFASQVHLNFLLLLSHLSCSNTLWFLVVYLFSFIHLRKYYSY